MSLRRHIGRITERGYVNGYRYMVIQVTDNMLDLPPVDTRVAVHEIAEQADVIAYAEVHEGPRYSTSGE